MNTHCRLFARTACMLLLVCLCATSALADMDNTQALMAAYAVIREQMDIGPGDVTLDMQHYDLQEGYWTFIFDQREHPDTNGRIFIQLNADGSLHEFRAPRSTRLIALEKRISQVWLGRYAFRGVEEWAQLKAEWAQEADALADLMREEEAQHRPEPSAQYLAAQVIGRDIRMPDAGSVPIEKARAAARDALLALPEMSEEKFAYYELRLEVHYHSQQLEKPVYQIVYAQHLRPMTDAGFETWLREYANPLDKLFGGHEFDAPIYMSVRVDALTGALAEPPTVEYLGPGCLFDPILRVR